MSSNPSEPLFRIATGYMASAALYVAAHLHVADHLIGGSKSVEELAAGTGANADALYRVLRLLVSLGVFEQVGPRRFALNPAADLLRRDVHGSVHPIAHFLPDPLHFRVYANLIDSVRTGLPAVDATLGKPLFEYLAHDPAYSAIFNDAMTAISTPAAAAAIAAYDFSRFEVVVDVAGGHGEVLTAILRASPGSRGVLAEIGHVADGARERIATMGLADRCEAVTCDFFHSVPEAGDVYVMKHIIHDWDDERALTILRNIAQAMGGKRGTVVLLETVIPETDEPDLGKFIDIEMLAFPGGKERTAHEFRVLFDEAGFELTRVVPPDRHCRSSRPSAASQAARMPVSIAPGIRFTARLQQPESMKGPAFLILPADASAKLPSRSALTVEGTINGHAFRALLQPDGQKSHWLNVTAGMLKGATARVGDKVTLEIAPAEKELETRLPPDLREALAAAPKAKAVWIDITPVARRDWVQWIISAKQAETRARRINNACDMLASGKRRVCCFDRSGFYSKAMSAPKAASLK